MSRRTKPVKEQVIEPFIYSNARFKKRLIDFDTGSAKLEPQHQDWLRQSMFIARTNSAFHVRLFGYASRLGDASFNRHLSLKRMNAVLSFLQQIDNRSLSWVEAWHAFGEEASCGGVNDDSPEWRAVEIHIFIGEIPPTPPPPNVTPVKPTLTPLPGGERFTKWGVATPGGAFVAEVVGVGFNIFFIKNEKREEIRGYIQPVVGPGASINLSGLKSVWWIIQAIVTGVQISAVDFNSVTTPHPVTWEEMEGCLVRVSSAGAGMLKAGGYAVITFSSSGIWQYGASGIPVRIYEDLFQFVSVGENWQIGVNASVAVGPLWRVA